MIIWSTRYVSRYDRLSILLLQYPMTNDYLKTAPQYIIPKRALNAYAQFMANIHIPVIKNRLIRNFIKDYNVNMSEALQESVENYACFNDFFIRHLKPGVRPIADAGIVSPVDGAISEIGSITAGKILQAKGQDYTVGELLACDEGLSSQFNNGHFATLYLSPKDYHRVHMPIEATLKEMIYVPGKLFSVQPTTARVVPKLFARNERLVVFFDTPIGLMAMVLVGAMVVGAIGTSWHGDIRRGRKPVHFDYHEANVVLKKAAEMGYFKLGSTVILLFADNQQMQWNGDLHAGDSIRMGEVLAEITA